MSFNSPGPSNIDNWWTGFKFNHSEKEVDFAAISKFGDADYLPAYTVSREFILLIGIAFIIVCPITWYYIHDWLSGICFEYLQALRR